MVPDGPAHPSQQGHQPSRNHTDAADAVAEKGQEGGNSCCIPSSILAEMNVKNRNASACTAKVPAWGPFCTVVLPAKVSCTRTQFHEKQNWQQDGDQSGVGRENRFDISVRWVACVSRLVRSVPDTELVAVSQGLVAYGAPPYGCITFV